MPYILHLSWTCRSTWLHEGSKIFQLPRNDFDSWIVYFELVLLCQRIRFESRISRPRRLSLAYLARVWPICFSQERLQTFMDQKRAGLIMICSQFSCVEEFHGPTFCCNHRLIATSSKLPRRHSTFVLSATPFGATHSMKLGFRFSDGHQVNRDSRSSRSQAKNPLMSLP